MKRLYLVLIVAALTLPQAGQGGWWKIHGDTGDDKGYCVHETSNGNYIVIGQKDLFTLWVFEIDTFGNILWEKTYDEGYGRWIEETSDGNYVIAGYPGLYKIDPDGEIIWRKDYGVGARCVQVLPEGGYVVVSLKSLFKTNQNGDTLWLKEFPDLELGFVQNTFDNCHIIVGSKSYLISEEIVQTWLYLMKTDSLGEIIWTQEYRGNNDTGPFENRGFCVKPTQDSGFIVVARRDPGGTWLLKVDHAGDTLWTKYYGGDGRNVQITSDNNYIITGGTETGTGELSSISIPQSSDFWLIKTNSLGDTIWTRRYGGQNTDAGRCVQQTEDGGYLAVGFTTSYGQGGSDAYLLKTDSLGYLCIHEQPEVELPVTWEITSSIGKSITLRFFNRPRGFHADIFDVSGRKVEEIYLPGSSGCFSWGNNQLPGVYFVVSSETNYTRTVKVVIIQ